MDKKIQGKKNRQAGARFELKVRTDLESKGWIVDRWSNNVDLEKVKVTANGIIYNLTSSAVHKLVPAKSNRFGLRNTGFPDFVCFKCRSSGKVWSKIPATYELHGVECKSNGYLDQNEKAKCRWYLDKNIFSNILIASKEGKRGKIIYKEFKWKE